MREIWTDTGSGRGRPAARSARGLTGRSLRCACASLLALLFLGLGAAPALALDPASLVKDIRPGSGNSGPSSFTNVAGTLFFGADDGTHRRELWKSDGTAAGTKLVKDIRPGGAEFSGSSHPSYLTNVAGTLFFAADDGSHGTELWKSDGTAAGTMLVKDIDPGASARVAAGLTNVDGTLFFAADDGTPRPRAVEERRHRGGHDARQGHQPRRRSSDPGNLTNVDGTLFFAANDGTHGGELWKSDGTAAGTKLVKDINPGAATLGSTSPTSRTSPARSSSRPTTAPTASSSGRATAPRRARCSSRTSPRQPTELVPRLPDERRRHAVLLGRRRHARRRAVEERRHRGRHHARQGHQPGRRTAQPRSTSTNVAARSSSRPTTAATAGSCGRATAPRPARRSSRTSTPAPAARSLG